MMDEPPFPAFAYSEHSSYQGGSGIQEKLQALQITFRYVHNPKQKSWSEGHSVHRVLGTQEFLTGCLPVNHNSQQLSPSCQHLPAKLMHCPACDKSLYKLAWKATAMLKPSRPWPIDSMRSHWPLSFFIIVACCLNAKAANPTSSNCSLYLS